MTQVPGGWVEVDLGDALASLEDGRTIHQGWSPQCEKQPSEDADAWGVLKTTAIQSGAFWPEHNKRLPDKLMPRPLLEVRRGDVLITCAGPRARCGVACLVRDTRPRLMLSGKMYRFRFDDRFIDPRYVEAYLLSDAAARAVDRMKTGISDSGLNLTHGRFRKLKFPLAPRAEQKRIVAAIEEHFSRLDAAEKFLVQAKHRVGLLRMSARSEAVAGDWPVVSLEEVTESQIYGSSVKATTDPAGVPILRMGNIRDGALVVDQLKYIRPDHPDVEKCRLQPGDLLFNRTNSPELVGKSAVFRRGPDPTVFASYLIRVRLSRDCDPDWAALVINSHLGRRYVASVRTQQVGQANVNGTKLAAMPIPLPPPEEQRRLMAEVERQLSVLDAMDAQIDRALRRSGALRRSILEQAFSGELVPQDPSDEPASALLERIAVERAAAPRPSRPKRKIRA
jgi:type I restriction enzyme S subunit